MVVAMLVGLLPCLVSAFTPTTHHLSLTPRGARAAVACRMPWEPEDMSAAASDESPDSKDKKGITFEGLSQLITMGAGAPMLGDLKKTNFNKPEAEGGAALQFELEANNFEDENGNLKSGQYRDEGWVDEDAPDPMEALKKMWPFGK